MPLQLCNPRANWVASSLVAHAQSSALQALVLLVLWFFPPKDHGTESMLNDSTKLGDSTKLVLVCSVISCQTVDDVLGMHSGELARASVLLIFTRKYVAQVKFSPRPGPLGPI